MLEAQPPYGERWPITDDDLYGIGVMMVAAAIEQNYDERGIVWHDAIASAVRWRFCQWYTVFAYERFETVANCLRYRSG